MFGINHNSKNIQLKFYYLCPDEDREIKSFGKFIYACDCEENRYGFNKSFKKKLWINMIYILKFAYCINVRDGRTYIKTIFLSKRTLKDSFQTYIANT